MDLSKIPTEDLYKELNSRKGVNKKDAAYAEIKALNVGGITTAQMHVEYIFEDSEWPHFMFYFDINGKSEDLYYGDVNLEYEDKVSFVPPCFAEASENSYEYNGPGTPDFGYASYFRDGEAEPTKEEIAEGVKNMLDGAREVLLKCGFKELREFNNEN